MNVRLYCKNMLRPFCFLSAISHVLFRYIWHNDFFTYVHATCVYTLLFLIYLELDIPSNNNLATFYHQLKYYPTLEGSKQKISEYVLPHYPTLLKDTRSVACFQISRKMDTIYTIWQICFWSFHAFSRSCWIHDPTVISYDCRQCELRTIKSQNNQSFLISALLLL